MDVTTEVQTSWLEWADGESSKVSDDKIIAYARGLRLSWISRTASLTIGEWQTRPKPFQTQLNLIVAPDNHTYHYDYLVGCLRGPPNPCDCSFMLAISHAEVCGRS